jgi:hypothetical protein
MDMRRFMPLKLKPFCLASEFAPSGTIAVLAA